MNLYDFTVKGKDGNSVSLGQYAGKVALVVNTATKCGLTPQYEALESLYEKLKDKGFVVLDFPCNQFLEQAPESDAEITTFCTLHFGTKFPQFAKIEVNGAHADPLYVWLKQQAPEDTGNEETAKFAEMVKQYTPDNGPADIKWNFGKFLIDRKGNVVARFAPAMPPEALEAEIEKLL